MSRKPRGRIERAVEAPPQPAVARYRDVIREALAEDSRDGVWATYRVMHAWVLDVADFERRTGQRVEAPFPAGDVQREIEEMIRHGR